MDETATKPVVWIIDSQQWPRAYLRAELIARGFDAVGFLDLSQALTGLTDPNYRRPQIIVLELHGLSLRQEDLGTLARVGIPTIALGGAVELNEEVVREFKWAAVIQRPFTIGRVADVVEELLCLPPERGR